VPLPGPRAGQRQGTRWSHGDEVRVDEWFPLVNGWLTQTRLHIGYGDVVSCMLKNNPLGHVQRQSTSRLQAGVFTETPRLGLATVAPSSHERTTGARAPKPYSRAWHRCTPGRRRTSIPCGVRSLERLRGNMAPRSMREQPAETSMARREPKLGPPLPDLSRRARTSDEAACRGSNREDGTRNSGEGGRATPQRRTSREGAAPHHGAQRRSR
jgi:hypothetical protein